jgi:hypothetical protein
MSLVKLFERLNTEDLFTFFQKQDYVTLHLGEDDYENLRRMKITGTSFLNCKKEDLMSYDSLKWGTAIEIDSLKQKVCSGKCLWNLLSKFVIFINFYFLVIKNAIKGDANYKKLESLIINEKVCQ